MVPASSESPSDAEWKILRIVFELGVCGARDVIAVADERHAWSASTVKTLLRRLVDKGHLRTRAKGKALLYRPSGTIHKALRASADELMGRTIDGAMGPLLQYMVQKSRLSRDDLDALRRLIDEQRSRQGRR